MLLTVQVLIVSSRQWKKNPWNHAIKFVEKYPNTIPFLVLLRANLFIHYSKKKRKYRHIPFNIFSDGIFLIIIWITAEMLKPPKSTDKIKSIAVIGIIEKRKSNINYSIQVFSELNAPRVELCVLRISRLILWSQPLGACGFISNYSGIKEDKRNLREYLILTLDNYFAFDDLLVKGTGWKCDMNLCGVKSPMMNDLLILIKYAIGTRINSR